MSEQLITNIVQVAIVVNLFGYFIIYPLYRAIKNKFGWHESDMWDYEI
jgi:hypothetical protein